MRSVAARKAAVERARKWAKANPEKTRANKRRYHEKNRAKKQKLAAEWQRRNPERARAASRRWYAKNTNAARSSVAKWRRENRDKCVAQDARRRARKLAAAVPLTLQEKLDVAEIYRKARGLTKLIGEPYHVDHIKPLSKGGLHHPSNLQVLRGTDNLKKGNRYE